MAVESYARLKGIEDIEDVDYLLRGIDAMDGAWLEWAHSEVDRSRANRQPKRGR